MTDVERVAVAVETAAGALGATGQFGRDLREAAALLRSLAADARRYRFLRECHPNGPIAVAFRGHMDWTELIGEYADAAVDEAIQRGAKGE